MIGSRNCKDRRAFRRARNRTSLASLQIHVKPLESRLLLTQGPTQVSTYVASSPLLISNVSVSDSQFVLGATVRITSGLVPAEDRLLFTNQNGISGSYNSTTGVLTLTGTATGTTYGAALNTVQYSDIAAVPSLGDRGFSVQLGTATYSSATGHYYQYVPGSMNWTTAKSIASEQSSLGLTGYLATITTSDEETFIDNTFGGVSGWLGASDSASVGTWRWVTGPEGTQSGGSGLSFYVSGGTNTAYNNWDSGNPTSSGSAYYAVMQATAKWDSVANTYNPSGYFIEYGGLGTTPIFYDRWLGTIHVLDRTASPTVTSPAAATLVNATSYAIAGTAPANSLVQVFADTDDNGVPDNPGSLVASEQLSSGATSFSINTPLTQYVANNFVILATAYTGANSSYAVQVPTITDNAPPTVASDNATVSSLEGGQATDTGTFSDPQGDSTVTLSASVGTLTQNNTTGMWSWSLNTPDGPLGPLLVLITATDNFNVATQTSFTYSVSNVAPTATLGSNGPLTYGQTATLSFSNPYDPSGPDTTEGFHYAFATSAGSSGGFSGVTYSTASTSPNSSVAGLGAGNHTFYARIIDKDDGFSEYSVTIAVAKANATVTVTPYMVTYDGSPHTASVASIIGVNGETGATVGVVDLSHTTNTNAGAYSTDYWSFTGSANYNSIGNTTITDTIARANATIEITGYDGTYDGLAHGASGTATGIGGIDLGAGLNLGATFVNVPGGTAAWSFSDDPNYNDQNGTVAVTINPAHLTTTAVVGTTDIGHGSPVPTPTFTFSGFVNGENSSVVSGTPGVTGLPTTTSPAGVYAVTPTTSNLSATNYDFPTVVPATLDVHPVVTDILVKWGTQTMSILNLTRDLPFSNISGFEVKFSDPVNIGTNGLSLTSTANGPAYAPAKLGSGQATSDASWSLPSVIGIDLLLLTLDQVNIVSSDAPTLSLFGTTMKAISVLPGDYNGDGVVSSADMTGVNNATVMPYDVFADLNGDGSVDINDVKIARAKIGTKLPPLN
jgi:hypothetical protein